MAGDAYNAIGDIVANGGRRRMLAKLICTISQIYIEKSTK